MTLPTIDVNKIRKTTDAAVTATHQRRLQVAISNINDAIKTLAEDGKREYIMKSGNGIPGDLKTEVKEYYVAQGFAWDDKGSKDNRAVPWEAPYSVISW